MYINIVGISAGTAGLKILSDSSSSPTTVVAYTSGIPSFNSFLSAMVLNGNYYSLTNGSGGATGVSISFWIEWY
jgi:hypothetical protein